MNERQACDLCGVLCEPVSLTEFSSQQLCPTCLENETRVCSHCNERIWADDGYGDASRPLCHHGAVWPFAFFVIVVNYRAEIFFPWSDPC